MIEGKRINDRYKILDLIGGGGMSNVYLAHDMILNRDVAVKILRYDAANEEEFHRRFQREALSATSLTHPNIVSIYDVGEDQDMHYIVMEYIKGKTLKQYINEFSPLTPARSVQIMKQLTSAIAHAHENQIIHRDIKPQNILVDHEGDVKVTDFGIATSLTATSYTKTNSVIGTVHYLSPEQARGGTATNQSDIYALGIVLYELLTGELPFSGESAVSIALKHLQTETPSIRALDASIPQSLENVVLKATAKNPLHRYASVEEMEEDLQTVLSPSRSNEKKFAPPIDDDETKAMPVIKEPLPIGDIANTKILSQETGKIEKVEPAKNHKKKKKDPKAGKKKKSRGKIWGIIIASILIIILAAILLFNLLSPKQVEIPQVANLEVDEAIELLETSGFTIGETKEKHSEDVEKGLVVETNPKAGLTRVEGTEIDLYVSLGTETVPMDDYVGKQIDQVTSFLENSDFKFRVVSEESSESEGTIIAQEPSGGEEVVPGETEIVLTVSQGKSYGTVEDLSGYNKASLKGYEQRSGFKIDISEDYSDDVPAGEVIEQSPDANKSLELGGKIHVVISKGPKEKESKMYYKTINIPYEPIQLGDKQQVRIFIQDKTHTMVEPFAEFTITEDTTYKLELEITEDQPAAYRIERDAMRIDEQTIPYDKVEE
ncbi:Stk1 family PASTA domain-containing Ser/Thr kinase [Lysinibacillus fusiformis]|nr:Stk1 family PASTA domain-containing Ser/Thr kinase [Lysinibacillus fusiformis]